jgi:hypothetical protein
LVEFSWSIIQQKMELCLGRCYWVHCLYIGPRCHEIQAWSLGSHRYILPCNQVPDAQQMQGSDMDNGGTPAHSEV